MYSGSIMGLALSPHMVSRLQWPSVFYVFGFIGIFWFLAWEKNASSSPAVDNKISKEERDYITSQTIKQVGEIIILQSCLLYWMVCMVCIVWIVSKSAQRILVYLLDSPSPCLCSIHTTLHRQTASAVVVSNVYW